jgi:myxalamid-type polyketide synthase MxaE and MxaD
VLADGRPADQPVLVGSVKTNLGHLEAAAGMAGLIKATLAVQHAQIPPSLHFHTPSPHVPWKELPVRVPTGLEEWPAQYATRIAGVSSFGFSGTNAHVVIEQAPPPQTVTATNRHPHLLPISARSSESLQALAEAYVEALDGSVSIHDVCYTASIRRSHHEHRLAVVAGSADEVRANLTTARRTRLTGERPRIGFVFPGQGGQHAGMARSLLAHEPVFRQAIEACHRAFGAYTQWSLLDLLEGEDESWMAEIDRIQPAIFAVQTALAALWRSWGVQPGGVIGHSMGEVAAAHTAGVLSLEDAARIICRRSALLKSTRAGGAMLVVDLPAAELGPLGTLSIAAHNGPRTTVVAGDEEALTAFAASLDARGVFCRRVQVSVAAHTAQVDTLAPALAQALTGVAPAPAAAPFYSTVTGALHSGEHCGAAYWMTNLRQPVQFWGALQAMIRDGFRTFIELSPHPVLGPSVEDGLRALAAEGEVRASLRRGEEDRRVMLETLGALYRQGQPIDWAALHPDGGSHVSLPTYRWQRKRFWLADRRGASSRAMQRVNVSLPGVRIWQADVSGDAFDGHRVQGEIVFPAAAFIQMARAAGDQLAQIRFEQMLFLHAGETRRLQLVVEGERFRISSCMTGAEAEPEWTLHATGSIAAANDERRQTDISEIHERCGETIDPDEFYTALSHNGLDYANEYRGITELWRGNGEALAKVAPSDDAAAQLDCCLQVLAAVVDGGGAFVPVAIESVEYAGKPEDELWVHARLNSSAHGVVQGDVTAVDANGRSIVRIAGLQAVRTGDDLRDKWYTLEWRRIERPEKRTPSEATWAIVADRSEFAAECRAILEQAGDSCVALSADLPCHGVIAMCSTAASLLELVQRLAQTGWRDAPRLYVVTRGAQSVAPGESADVSLAPIWGLARTIALEHPELRCTRLDLDPDRGADEVSSLCDVCLADLPEQEIAWRSGALYVSRLARTRMAPCDPPVVRADATYVITGGFGGIGLTVARWLVDRGARHLLLTGRREPSEVAAAALQVLRDAGADLITASADVADFEQLSHVMAMANREIRGVFHCAGVLDDGIVVKLNRERLDAVMKPKVDGAWNLHRLTAGIPLDHFVLFSSAAAWLGSPGQSNYTAANASLDALAYYRRSLSLPALSINWGPWADVGLAAAQENRGRRLAAQGLGSLTPEQGIRALELMLGQTNARPSIAVLPFNLRQWREFHPAAASLPLFAELMQEAGKRPRPAPATLESYAALESHVRSEVAAVLRLEPEQVEGHVALGGLGLDSLMGLEVRNRLENSLGLTLPASLVWTYPTVNALTAQLAEVLHIGPAAATDAAPENELEHLSEREAELLLEEELAALDKRREAQV